MILAIFTLTICLILFCLLTTFLYYLVITGMFSVPFVPTSAKDLNPVLKRAKLKRGIQFVDLGCGDGRLVIEAVRTYTVKGVGIDINPLLIWFAKIRVYFLKLENAIFLRKDLYSYSLENADVVYLFLFPRMMDKMSAKIKKECKKGTLIISRGFELPGFKKIDEIPTKTFETFFYKV